ncbi:MAG TPA: hypothetical protein VM888_14630 [Chitinophagaceae bacterium]|jgi:hypothetical protein|nr:hypothetical protein [Chitinophagaceae bacterium]
MDEVTLLFPSIVLVVDYLFVHPDCIATIDHDAFTLKGRLSTIEIELAINAYEAKVNLENNNGA